MALAALREPLPADDAVHLERCAQCRTEVTALQRGVDALAVPALAATGPEVTPPPGVWTAIAAATGVQVAPRPERTVPEAAGRTSSPLPGSPPQEPAEPRRLRAQDSPPLPRSRDVRSRDVPRVRRRLVPMAVAAAVLGAGIALGAVALANRPVGTQVAATPLQALERSGASGTAVVVEHADHSRELEVTLHGPPPASGYYQAWLADAGLDRMVAVGVLHDGTTTLPLPDGLNIGSYPVVDVSLQQLNGNPAHSDHSIARGRLRS